jgi:predicted transglutaminase-like cysteine proteinase
MFNPAQTLKSAAKTAVLAALLALPLFAGSASANTPTDQQDARAVDILPAGSVSAAAFPKWTGALARNWALQGSAQACAKKMGRDCQLGRWGDFLAGLQGQDPASQLRQVNSYVNAVTYRSDDRVWGKRDYWAAPGEFFAKGGDCEDYAVAKYLSLKALGFDPKAMRIMVLKDTRRGLLHAVLLVTFGGDTLVLDNLSSSLTSWSRIPNYKPLYAVNETDFWLHPGLKAG